MGNDCQAGVSSMEVFTLVVLFPQKVSTGLVCKQERRLENLEGAVILHWQTYIYCDGKRSITAFLRVNDELLSMRTPL